jgi:hypothetical protein
MADVVEFTKHGGHTFPIRTVGYGPRTVSKIRQLADRVLSFDAWNDEGDGQSGLRLTCKDDGQHHYFYSEGELDEESMFEEHIDEAWDLICNRPLAMLGRAASEQGN